MPTKIKETPSREYLKSNFFESEGFIYWKPFKLSRERYSEKSGKRVSSYRSKLGYWKVTIKGEEYTLSRIIYQFYFGDLTPEYEVDHIDRDTNNNCIENLRMVPQQVNKRNKPRQRNSPDNQVVGVQLCRKKHPKPYQHKISEYFVARWYDLDGKLKGKSFSINKLGREEAYRMAIEYRSLMIESLNKDGAGYHHQHGK